MLLKQGEYAAAEADYRAALASAERLAAAEPTNVQAQRDLAVSLAKLGDALARQGKAEAALAEYAGFARHREPLAAADPANVGLQRDVFKSHEAIGSHPPGARGAGRRAGQPSRLRSPLPSRWRRPIRQTAWRSAS